MTGGGQEIYEQVLAVPLAFGRDRALLRQPSLAPGLRPAANDGPAPPSPFQGLGPYG